MQATKHTGSIVKRYLQWDEIRLILNELEGRMLDGIKRTQGGTTRKMCVHISG